MNEETVVSPPDPHRHHRGPLPPGTPPRFGRYETWSVLGAGAFGRVYLARDTEMNRYVAIKTPKDPLPLDAHRAFLREARVIAQIHHPNVCLVFDVGVEEDLPYFVMQYVRGGTLADLIDRELPTPAQALGFVQQIANGLDAVHHRDIFHRDLKPANVLYDIEQGRLLLTDFGIARWEDATITRGSVAGGTPLYMAPEQWGPNGPFGAISARTDLYSLGVILFRLLTGERLFEGSERALEDHHQHTPPRRPSTVRRALDPRLDDLCLKALAKQQGDRYASAKDFAAAIAEYLCQAAPVPQPVVAPTVPASPRPAAPPHEHDAGDEVSFPLPGGLEMVFCWIPKGECQLGSPKAERDAVLKVIKQNKEPPWLQPEDETTRGTFRTNGFWLGKHTVTQAQWRSLMGNNPSYFSAGGGGAGKVQGLDTSHFPVESLSWDMICLPGGFLEKLNACGGRAGVFGVDAAFALPHEDMWEYACRRGLGNTRPFHWGPVLNGREANTNGNVPFGTPTKGRVLNRPCPVDYTGEGNYPLHPWGLMHMHGNVWEWCENLYAETAIRALRGGSWHSHCHDGRTANRGNRVSTDYESYIGFRLCLPGLQ